MKISTFCKVFDPKFENETCFIFSDGTIQTYGEVKNQVRKLADFLSKNLKGSQVVLLYINPDDRFITSFLAVILAGHIPFIAALDLKDELKEIRKAFDVIITDDEGVANLKENLKSDTPETFLIDDLFNWEGQAADDNFLEEINELSELVRCHSSGSTGIPKIISGTWKKYFLCLENLKKFKSLKREDVFLTFAPFNHVYGLLLGMFLPLSLGGKIKIKKGGLSSFDICEPELMKGTHYVVATPPVYNYLSQMGEDLEADVLKDIKSMISSTVKIEENTVKFLKDKFKINLLEIYGTSEVLVIGVREGLPSDPWTFFLGVDWQLGEQGNLKIKSFLNPGEEEPSWFDTGDIINLFENNINFQLGGRTKEFLKIRGQKVFLAEIEDQVSKNTKIHESAVWGNQELQEAVLFFVSQDETLTEKALREDLLSRVAPKLVPKFIFKVESLPRNNVGKIDRKRLEELFQKLQES